MTPRSDIVDLKATALADDDTWHDVATDVQPATTATSYDLEDRAALRRVAGLSTELEDVTEVEYRQLRLERVVLAGVWTEGTVEDAENSLRELAALAETAGSDGARRRSPAPAQARPRHLPRLRQGPGAARHRHRRPAPTPSSATAS